MLESNFYNTESDANEVLDYYENLILRSKHVLYIAVVKKQEIYQIEIGISESNSVKIIDIDPQDAYFGNFPPNEIPEYLPIPSQFKFILQEYYKLSNNNIKTNENTRLYSSIFKNASIRIEKKDFKKSSTSEDLKSLESTDIKSSENKETIIKLNSERNKDPWFVNYPYGGQPIKYHLGGTGTLGAIFKLMEFPGKLFGISNWHVLVGSKKLLGKDIFSPEKASLNNKKTKRGHLFWSGLNINIEAAFMEFNGDIKNIIDKYQAKSDYTNWVLGQPKIGMLVNHKGYGTGNGKEENSTEKTINPKIYSVNATVRIDISNYKENNGKKIFKNQILIKERNTTNGDSGSLVIVNDKGEPKVVGLNFAGINGFISDETINKNDLEFKYSVANNLNLIFNTKFSNKQEVFLLNDQNKIYTTLINQFTLDNSKFK